MNKCYPWFKNLATTNSPASVYEALCGEKQNLKIRQSFTYNSWYLVYGKLLLSLLPCLID
jgi:hypothetical protein